MTVKVKLKYSGAAFGRDANHRRQSSFILHDNGHVPNAKPALLLVHNKFNLVTLAQLRPQQWACVSWQYIN